MSTRACVTSPPLRHAYSEGRLRVRRRASLMLPALPELQPCSSEATLEGLEHTGRSSSSKACGKSTSSLPPLSQDERHAMRSRALPYDHLSHSKRARSNGGSKLHSLASLPPLCSLSTGALPKYQGGSELEEVLLTALGKSTKKEKALSNATHVDDHLEQMLDMCDALDASVADKKHNPKKLGSHKHKAKIMDCHRDCESHIVRKGTGFVHLDKSIDAMCKPKATIADDHGDNENKLFRKGTGFVHLRSLPKESPNVWFSDVAGGEVNRIHRKGTGFIALPHVAPKVRIADTHGDNENGIQRKGTGFIHLHACDSVPSPSAGSISTQSPSSGINDSSVDEMSSEGEDLL